MATEKTYYTIDPEGKLTCMKCKVPLRKGNAKFMYLDTVSLWNCRCAQSAASSMSLRNWPWARCFLWRKPWRISDVGASRRRAA